MAKLSDLDASFVGNYAKDARGQDSFHQLPNIEGAQGLLFVCPLCGNHSVLCWFANPRNAPPVPDDAYPKPGRWQVEGTGMVDVTLSPSVNLGTTRASEDQSCLWHGWVTAGYAS